MTRGQGIYWVYGTALIGLGLIIISLGGNILGSFSDEGQITDLTLKNYKRLLGSPEMPGVLGRTIVLGLGTIVTMLLFALPFAWLLSRTDYRWKTALFTVMAAKLAIPGFITAMAYVWLANPTSGIINQLLGMTAYTGEPALNVYQLKWVFCLQGLVLVPGAVFMLVPAFRNLDSTLEEAALVHGVGYSSVFRHVVVPLLAPGVLAVSVFYFIIGVEMFDFVAIIGVPGDVLVLKIYEALTEVDGLPDYGLAGASGVLLFAICSIAIIFYIRFLKESQRFAVMGGKRRRPTLLRLGRWHGVATGYLLLWVILSVGIPAITLVWVALVPYFQPPSAKALDVINWNGFIDAFDYIGEPLTNTFLVMIGAATIAITFATAITWVVTRSRSPVSKWADTLVFLAPAVPSIVAATAFQVVGIAVYQWLPLYGTLWLIIVALGTRMLAYCTRTMNSASLQIQPELEEAAFVSGVSRWGTFWGVFVPLMAPALFYSALMVGMLAARDLTLPLVMSTGGKSLVSVLIFDLQTNGEMNAAAAVALYMIVILVLLALTARKLTGMGEPGLDTTSGRT